MKKSYDNVSILPVLGYTCIIQVIHVMHVHVYMRSFLGH